MKNTKQIQGLRGTITHLKKVINLNKKFLYIKDNKEIIKRIFEELELRGRFDIMNRHKGKNYYNFRIRKTEYDWLKEYFTADNFA